MPFINKFFNLSRLDRQGKEFLRCYSMIFMGEEGPIGNKMNHRPGKSRIDKFCPFKNQEDLTVMVHCVADVAYRTATDIFRYPHHPAGKNSSREWRCPGLLLYLRSFETFPADPVRGLIIPGHSVRKELS